MNATKFDELDVSVTGLLFEGFIDQIDWANADPDELLEDYEITVDGRSDAFTEEAYAIFMTAIEALRADPAKQRTFLGWIAIRGEEQAGRDIAVWGSIPKMPIATDTPGSATLSSTMFGLIQIPEITVNDGLVEFSCS